MLETKIEHLVQIVVKILANSVSEIHTFEALYSNCESELEVDYNDNYKYCLSIFIQNDIITDWI